jgi:hypothetical protein
MQHLAIFEDRSSDPRLAGCLRHLPQRLVTEVIQ